MTRIDNPIKRPAWTPAPAPDRMPGSVGPKFKLAPRPKAMGGSYPYELGLFSLDQIPSLVLNSAGGAALFLVGGAFSEPFSTLVKIGGAGLFGYGAYRFFQTSKI